MNWEAQRNLIPACKNYAYLMSAAAGPLHPRALEASKAYLQQLHEHGDKFWEDSLNRVEETRRRVAKILNVQSEEICFVSSSSMAVSLAADLLRRRGKTKLWSFKEEFPTTTLPWLNAGFEAQLEDSPSGEHDWKDILNRIPHSNDVVVAASHVESLTGFRHPIERMAKDCQERNIPFFVNATQSLGVNPISAESIPFLCASIHKWLMAGFGLSVFRVDRSSLEEGLPVYGWLSQKDPWKFFQHELDPLNEARVLELGCSPILQILSLGAVFEWIDEIGGVAKIWERLEFLRSCLLELARKEAVPVQFDFSPQYQSSLIFFPCSNAENVEKELAKKNILVNVRGNSIRVALHWFNNQTDIERFIDAMKRLTE